MKTRGAHCKICLPFMFILSFLISLIVMTGAMAQSSQYGKVIGDWKLNVRQGPSKSTKALFRIKPGAVIEVTGNTTDEKGAMWYYVNVQHPTNKKIYNACVMGDFVRLVSESEAKALNTNAVADQTTQLTAITKTVEKFEEPVVAAVTTQSSSGSVMYGYINRGGGTNFRKQPKLSAPLWEQLVKRTVVEVLSVPDIVTNDSWYKVRYNGHVGYIMSQFVTLTTVDGFISSDKSSDSTSTSTVSGKFVKLTKTSCHLRKTPNGVYEIDWEGKGETLPIVGSTVKKGNYTWYPVSYEDSFYYVRNDCVQVVN